MRRLGWVDEVLVCLNHSNTKHKLAVHCGCSKRACMLLCPGRKAYPRSCEIFQIRVNAYHARELEVAV